MRRVLSTPALLIAGLLVLDAPLHASGGAQTVVIVRHAERAEAPPGDVALSEAGQARAEELVTALAEARIDTIITTQFRRTRDTAAPLVRALGLTAKVVEAGRDTTAHAAAIAAAIRAGGQAILVVGHSNTVPAIINALGGPVMDELCESEYSNLFVISLAPGRPARLVHGHYGAADPPSAAECRRGIRR